MRDGAFGVVVGIFVGVLGMWAFFPPMPPEPEVIYKEIPFETVKEVVRDVPGPERIVYREHEPTWSPQVCVLGKWLD